MPVEIARYLLEVAAEQDKATSLALVRVSKAVETWITPIIYHTVILLRRYQSMSFYHTLKALKPSVGPTVRSLVIQDSVTHPATIAGIVRRCTDLQTLVSSVNVSGPKFMAMIDPSFPGPWHMVLRGLGSKMPPLDHQLLRNVTHFYIEDLREEYVDRVQSLPRLTHLGFGCWGDLEPSDYVAHITRALSSPCLLVLILQAMSSRTVVLEGDTWWRLAEIPDERLLARPGFPQDDTIAQVTAGETMWDDAQAKYGDWRRLVKGKENGISRQIYTEVGSKSIQCIGS